MRNLAWLTASCLWLGAAAFAQKPPAKFLTVGEILPAKLGRPATVELTVPVVVEPGLHVQANPAANPQLIPTRLEVKAAGGINVGEPTYPSGKPYRLQGAASDISVYDGSFEIRISVSTTPKTPKGKRQIEGKLKFQACNDKICFFPTSVPVKLNVDVQ